MTVSATHAASPAATAASAALLEDLDAGSGGGRMAGRDAGLDPRGRHEAARGIAAQPTRATPARGKSRRWLISSPPAKP
jgi:hypothetical protein